jgi:Tfp pilus assembly protein PilZ
MISERRKSTRYEVSLSAHVRDKSEDTSLIITSHDLSSSGVGMIADGRFEVGQVLEFSLIIDDRQEQISFSGRVVWIKAIGPERYRLGISLIDSELQPIPIVLRSIRLRTVKFND